MAASKNVNDRKRAQVKARKDSFINGNRKERRAFANKTKPVETPVTDGLKAKAKAKKVKEATPVETPETPAV
jgi:hypothetical protein